MEVPWIHEWSVCVVFWGIHCCRMWSDCLVTVGAPKKNTRNISMRNRFCSCQDLHTFQNNILFQCRLQNHVPKTVQLKHLHLPTTHQYHPSKNMIHYSTLGTTKKFYWYWYNMFLYQSNQPYNIPQQKQYANTSEKFDPWRIQPKVFIQDTGSTLEICLCCSRM